MQQGFGVSPELKSDTPVLDVTIKNGQIEKTHFH